MSFENQLASYSDSLIRAGYTLTRSMDSARDLAQDTLLAALRFKDKFKEGSNLKGWLHTILRNLAYNRAKQERDRAASFRRNYRMENAVPLAGSNLGVDEIYREIETLPVKLKNAFKLYIEGSSPVDGAAELHIPCGTFRSRVHKAKRHVAKRVSRY